MTQTRSRLVTVVLALAVAWGLWTTVNIVRLGPRGSSPALYWSAAVLIAVVTCGLGYVLKRRLSRRQA